MDYVMIDVFGAPGGDLMKRMLPDQQIMDYIGVPSVDEYAAKVENFCSLDTLGPLGESLCHLLGISR